LGIGSTVPPTGEGASVVQQDAQAAASAPVQPAVSEERETTCEKEEKCLADLHRIASRSGNVLKLKLDSGAIKTFRSDPKACEDNDARKCSEMTLVGYMPPQHMFVLRKGAYELVRYLVVSGQNGKSFELEDQPHLAPDGKRFVVVAVDEMNGWDKDVAIFSTSSFPPRLEWSYKTQKPDEFALYSFVGWDGNGRIKLRVNAAQVEGADAEVTRTAEGWKIRLRTGELRTGTSAVRPGLSQ
jgi:hypothetical protein